MCLAGVFLSNSDSDAVGEAKYIMVNCVVFLDLDSFLVWVWIKVTNVLCSKNG